jgi:UDP:flavonoid glycosyltransferase YjiC (YdhE family)
MRHDTSMRILVSSSPGVGHLLPMLPVAREARARGHEVVVAAGASLAPIVAGAGLPHEPMGPTTIREAVATVPELRGLTGRKRAAVTLRAVFCGQIAPAMADGILALSERWKPDVIIHEDIELGSWVVAERLGIPHVTIQATAWRPTTRGHAFAALEPQRERFGLAPGGGPDRLLGQVFFTTRPASLRDPNQPLPAVTAELRPIADDLGPGGAASEDDPFPPKDGRPRVAITLGTVNFDQVALLRAMIDGAVAADAQVAVALGADPDSLGPVPPSVVVHAYMPMSTLLPAADLVAHHGGSGTMLAALAVGTPQVIVPIAADQPDNADQCHNAGVGRIVALEDADATAIKTAIDAVLRDASYQGRSREVAAEIAAMPGPGAAMDRIESIAPSRAAPSDREPAVPAHGG